MSETARIRTFEHTLAIVKPDAMEAGHLPAIITRIDAAQLEIAQLHLHQLKAVQVAMLYAEHLQKPFMPQMAAFMMQSRVAVLLLYGLNCVARWRDLMGPTDSRNAKPDTLRGLYGNKEGIIFKNAVHGSDSSMSAAREIGMFFGFLHMPPGVIG